MIGRAIQAALDQHGLSQSALAKQIGIDKATLGRWIRGERDPYSNQPPSYREMIIKIDGELGSSLVALHDDLTGYRPRPERQLSPAGQMIHARMQERGLTESQLSRVSRVSMHNLAGILSGSRGPELPLYAPQLVTLARTLDIDATQLLAAGGVVGEAATIALMAALIESAPEMLAALNADLADKLKENRAGREELAQGGPVDDRIFD